MLSLPLLALYIGSFAVAVIAFRKKTAPNSRPLNFSSLSVTKTVPLTAPFQRVVLSSPRSETTYGFKAAVLTVNFADAQSAAIVHTVAGTAVSITVPNGSTQAYVNGLSVTLGPAPSFFNDARVITVVSTTAATVRIAPAVGPASFTLQTALSGSMPLTIGPSNRTFQFIFRVGLIDESYTKSLQVGTFASASAFVQAINTAINDNRLVVTSQPWDAVAGNENVVRLTWENPFGSRISVSVPDVLTASAKIATALTFGLYNANSGATSVEIFTGGTSGASSPAPVFVRLPFVRPVRGLGTPGSADDNGFVLVTSGTKRTEIMATGSESAITVASLFSGSTEAVVTLFGAGGGSVGANSGGSGTSIQFVIPTGTTGTLTSTVGYAGRQIHGQFATGGFGTTVKLTGSRTLDAVAGAGGGASVSGVGGRSWQINQDAFGGAPTFAGQLQGVQPSVMTYGEGASLGFAGQVGQIQTVLNTQLGRPAAGGGTGFHNGGSGVFAGFTVGSGGGGLSRTLNSTLPAVPVSATSSDGSGPSPMVKQWSEWASVAGNMMKSMSDVDRRALARAVLASALSSVADNATIVDASGQNDFFWPQDPVWNRQGLLPLGPHAALVPTTQSLTIGIPFVGQVKNFTATTSLSAAALELLTSKLYTSALTFSTADTALNAGVYIQPTNSWPSNTTAALLQTVWPLIATTQSFVGSPQVAPQPPMIQIFTESAARGVASGQSDSFTVPLLYKSLMIEAHGTGGSSMSSFPGGHGACVRMDGASLAGHQLRVSVGQVGFARDDNSFLQAPNGGGKSGSGFTGGGMSAIFDVTDNKWLLVAAGGGGGGTLGPGLSAESKTVGNGFSGRSASFNRGGSGFQRGSSFFGGSTDSSSGGGGQGFHGGGSGSRGFGGGAGSSFADLPAVIETSTKTRGGEPGSVKFTFVYT